MTPSSPMRERARALLEEVGSLKIQPGHRDRLAVVYVRQSTPQHVLDHQESTRLQYGLARHAEALGRAPERIVVIESEIIGKNVEIFYTPEDRARGIPRRNLRLAAVQGRRSRPSTGG